MLLTIPTPPSYSHGYAHSRGESAYPQLWDGLVGAWVPAFGSTGLILRDVSGNNNHGTLTNMDMADWVLSGDSQVQGYVSDFDGSNDYINIPFSRISAFPFTLIVRVSDISVGASTIMSIGDVNQAARYHSIGKDASGIVRIASRWFIAAYQNGTTNIEGTGWFHIAIVYVSDTSKFLFVNGQNEAEMTSLQSMGTINTIRLAVSANNAPSLYMNGLISYAAIYDRVLTPAEIFLDYLVPLAPFIRKEHRLLPSSIVPNAATIVIPRDTPPSYSQGYARSRSDSEQPGLREGLVGAWSLGLGVTGLQLFDASGNGNHGTLTNMGMDDWVLTGDPRLSGYALDFDGTSYVSMGDVLDFDRTDPFSIALWFKRGTTGFEYVVSKKQNGSPYTGYRILIDPTDILEFWFAGNVDSLLVVGSDDTFTDTDWHHWVTTYDGSSNASGVMMYIDGSNIATTIQYDNLALTTLNNVDFQISGQDGANSPFTGLLTNILIYNRVLTPSEILTLYQIPDAPWRLKQRYVTIGEPEEVGRVTRNTDPYYHGVNLGISRWMVRR